MPTANKRFGLFFILFTVPLSTMTVQVSPSSSGSPTTGSSYSLNCIALEQLTGLTGIPSTAWIGPGGEVVDSTGGITVGTPVSGGGAITTQVLTFSSMRTSYAGAYSCRATLESPALSVPSVIEEYYVITVTGNTC